jgi:hypothetical protein
MNAVIFCPSLVASTNAGLIRKSARRPRAGLLRRLADCVPGSREANRLLRELRELARRTGGRTSPPAKKTARRD